MVVALSLALASDCAVALPAVVEHGPWPEPAVFPALRGDAFALAAMGDRIVATLDEGRVQVGDQTYETGFEATYEVAASACCAVVNGYDGLWILGADGRTRVVEAEGGVPPTIDDTGRVVAGGWLVEPGREPRQLYGPWAAHAFTWDEGTLYGVGPKGVLEWSDLDAMPAVRPAIHEEGEALELAGRFAAVIGPHGGRVVDLATGAVVWTWEGALSRVVLHPSGLRVLADVADEGVARVDPGGWTGLTNAGPREVLWVGDTAVGAFERHVLALPSEGWEHRGPRPRALIAVDGVVEVDGQWLSASGIRGEKAVRIGDRVVLAGYDAIAAVDVATGAEVWRLPAPSSESIDALDALGPNRVGFGSWGSRLVVVDADGQTRDTHYGTGFAEPVAVRTRGRDLWIGERALWFGDREIPLGYGADPRWIELDGPLAAVGFGDAHVELRDLSGDIQGALGPVAQHLAWLPDGTLVTAGRTGVVTRFDRDGRPMSAMRPAPQHPIDVVALGPEVVTAYRDGTLATACATRVVEGLEAVAGGKRLAWTAGSELFVGSSLRAEVSWSVDGLAWSDGGDLAVSEGYRVLRFAPKGEPAELETELYGAAVAWMGETLLVGDERRVSRQQGKRFKPLFETSDDIALLAATNGAVATVSWNGLLELWSAGGQRTHTAFAAALPIDLAWSPDGGSVAASFSDGSVRVWRADGALAHVLRFEGAALHLYR